MIGGAAGAPPERDVSTLIFVEFIDLLEAGFGELVNQEGTAAWDGNILDSLVEVEDRTETGAGVIPHAAIDAGCADSIVVDS